MKTADLQLKFEDDRISVTSLKGNVVDVTATATSLASQKISINDAAVEDLLVFTTGTGARLIGVFMIKSPLRQTPIFRQLWNGWADCKSSF